jgi:hypothetical protein
MSRAHAVGGHTIIVAVPTNHRAEPPLSDFLEFSQNSKALDEHIVLTNDLVERGDESLDPVVAHGRELAIPEGSLPEGRKAFTCRYPDEDRALLGTVDVELVRRLFYGVLSREGLRREELASLCFRELDLKRGHIALDRNKTHDPRSWALSPDVARA